jgi:hypothetical protein
VSSGRPSLYTPELAAAICARLADGESLKSICSDEAMPSKSSVYLWLQEKPKFSELYARAKEDSADALADEILEISDNAKNDWMQRHGKDDAGWVANGEHIQRSRLRVDARKWIASKLKPKKYGEKLDVNAEIGIRGRLVIND